MTDGTRSFRSRLAPLERQIRSRFEIDTRSLAALRIALGLILLIDLVHRAGSIEQYYTDSGVYPLAAFEETYTVYNSYSIHALSGDLWFQQVLFGVAALFAIALLVGYRTRLVAVVSFALLLSLHARNPAVLNGADRLLRVLLLVALVTPLGERWSIDALRRGSARTTVVNVTTVALLLQPLIVLSQNAIFKHRGETWYAGEAVQIALSNDEMTIYLGNYLVEYPLVLEALNWIWVTLLAGSIGFLWLTNGRLRAFFALVYMGAFIGMLPTLSVGLFPLVLFASVLPFLTTPFWELAERLAPIHRLTWRPSKSTLGPLGRPPIEHRIVESLRENGRESVASFLHQYSRSLVTVAGVLLLSWMLLSGVTQVTGHDVPDEVDPTILDTQNWGLYAPNPSESYNWNVVQATLEDGSTVDAIDGGEVVMDRPPDAAQEYESFRERKFMQTVRDSGKEDTSSIVAESYAQWACERAAAEHGPVETVTVIRFIQPSPIDGTYDDPNHTTLIEWEC